MAFAFIEHFGKTLPRFRRRMLAAKFALAVAPAAARNHRGNALVGAWWLDPAVGLLIAAVAVKEGAEAWRGEGCCVASPLDGVGFADDCCDGHVRR